MTRKPAVAMPVTPAAKPSSPSSRFRLLHPPMTNTAMMNVPSRYVTQSGGCRPKRPIELAASRDLIGRGARGAEIRADEATALKLEPRKASLRTPRLEVTAQRSQLTTGVGRLIANHVQASAETLVTRVERYEMVAERLVERTQTALREVSDLLQTKSGRVRSFVHGVYAMYSGRTVMVSEQDTSIDGEKVLLG